MLPCARETKKIESLWQYLVLLSSAFVLWEQEQRIEVNKIFGPDPAIPTWAKFPTVPREVLFVLGKPDLSPLFPVRNQTCVYSRDRHLMGLTGQIPQPCVPASGGVSECLTLTLITDNFKNHVLQQCLASCNTPASLLLLNLKVVAFGLHVCDKKGGTFCLHFSGINDYTRWRAADFPVWDCLCKYMQFIQDKITSWWLCSWWPVSECTQSIFVPNQEDLTWEPFFSERPLEKKVKSTWSSLPYGRDKYI